MHDLGVPAREWADVAHQDAALRFGGALLGLGKLRRRPEARDFLACCERHPADIPPRFWTIRQDPADASKMIIRGVAFFTACAPGFRSNAGADSDLLARMRIDAEPRVWLPVWQALRETGWLLPSTAAVAFCLAAFGTVI